MLTGHAASSSSHNVEVCELVEGVNFMFYLVSYMDINIAFNVSKDLQTLGLSEGCEPSRGMCDLCQA